MTGVDVRRTMLIREPRSGLCGQEKSVDHDSPIVRILGLGGRGRKGDA